MNGVKRIIAKNAAANIVRGLATAAVAIALPHFLAHALDREHFSAWSLILQISAYASFLDFGLQSALARFFTQAIEMEDTNRRDRLVSTALAMLGAAGTVSLIVIASVTWLSPRLFAGIPMSLIPEFRVATLTMGFGACLVLPTSTFTGVLIGLHRNELPALAIGFSRVLGAIAVLAAARITHSLVALAACVVVGNLLGSVLQMVMVKRVLPDMRVKISHINPDITKELIRYCFGLCVWSFGMLLISGLDLTVVGHYRFSQVGAYAVSSTLISFFAGLNQSIIGTLMTPIAALHVHLRWPEIRKVVLSAGELNSFANIIATCVTILFGAWFLGVWVGNAYAVQAQPILVLLMIAQTLRLLANPYSTMLAGVGEQNRAILPAIVEAISNLALSIIGAMYFGAIGVAWGTLLGAFIGLAVQFGITMPRVLRVVPISRWDLVRSSALSPMIQTLPVVAVVLLNIYTKRSAILPFGLACVISGGLLRRRLSVAMTPTI